MRRLLTYLHEHAFVVALANLACLYAAAYMPALVRLLVVLIWLPVMCVLIVLNIRCIRRDLRTLRDRKVSDRG